MRRLGTVLFTLLNVLMVVCLVGMVIMVFGNVVLCYGFDLGISMSEEVSRFLFVWLTFLGAIAALRNFDHLGVDSLLKALPRPSKGSVGASRSWGCRLQSAL